MSFDLPYGTLLSYSPRGDTELAEKSRKICGRIKKGDTALIDKAFQILKEPRCSILQPFLNSRITLVPVPRSSRLVEGGIWPSKIIADLLLQRGYASHVLPCIKREKAVPKSSSSPSNERPSVDVHYESLAVSDDQLFRPDQITLVDDVLTQGRTTVACARRLMEAYPDAEIRVFAVVRTVGFQEINTIIDPVVEVIKYYPSGKTFRQDPE